MMEGITVIWYFSSFLVLIIFFIIIACSDSNCGRRSSQSSTTTSNSNKTVAPRITPPLTPAPSYSEFAPPNYDSVITRQCTGSPKTPEIYIISVNEKLQPEIVSSASTVVIPDTSRESSI